MNLAVLLGFPAWLGERYEFRMEFISSVLSAVNIGYLTAAQGDVLRLGMQKYMDDVELTEEDFIVLAVPFTKFLGFCNEGRFRFNAPRPHGEVDLGMYNGIVGGTAVVDRAGVLNDYAGLYPYECDVLERLANGDTFTSFDLYSADELRVIVNRMIVKIKENRERAAQQHSVSCLPANMARYLHDLGIHTLEMLSDSMDELFDGPDFEIVCDAMERNGVPRINRAGVRKELREIEAAERELAERKNKLLRDGADYMAELRGKCSEGGFKLLLSALGLSEDGVLYRDEYELCLRILESNLFRGVL